MNPFSPLIVALDLDDLAEVRSLVQSLGSQVLFYKVGLKLFTRHGPDLLRFLQSENKFIFLDLKFHDIPNTVAEACREATRWKVQMLTLHASGGGEMMRAAARAVREEAQLLGVRAPLLMGVTVLTSMNSLQELGVPRSPKAQVKKLARLAFDSGLDGVICSPQEIQTLRRFLPETFCIVTPGVRPPGSDPGDQKRIATPEQAWRWGASAVVMGRPIFSASDPRAEVAEILRTYTSL